MSDECKTDDDDSEGKIKNSFLIDIIVNNDDNNLSILILNIWILDAIIFNFKVFNIFY